MIQLHLNGHSYDLADDYKVSDVFHTLTELAKDQDGDTWFQLKDPRQQVHVHLGTDNPTFAVVNDQSARQIESMGGIVEAD